jgi:membrane-bound ClpP family serine protease
LAPFGYILVRGELWQAEVEEGGPPIDRGERVKVKGMRGLRLLVTPYDEEEN